MFKLDPYPLTPVMMQIADNPSNPWLDEYLKAHGVVAYKFSQPCPRAKAKTK